MNMTANSYRKASLSVLIIALLATTAMIVPDTAQADLSVSGDYRLRFEADWDSHKTSGKARDDRNRARIRARVGLNYNHNDLLSFGARLRSGSDNDHLSPHVTIVDFEDNDTGDAHFNFDKWFFKAKTKGLWGWAGRNSLPFWKQNEMFWDDDATLAGFAGGYKMGFGNSEVALNTGYLSLPTGMKQFSGNLALGQLVFSTKFGASNKITAAAGLLAFDANPEDKDATHKLLWDANGGRDYRVWIGSLQGKFKAGNLPLTLGVDMMHNAQGYSDSHVDMICVSNLGDPSTDSCNRHFTRDNRDNTDGYVASIKLGQLKNKRDWLVGYSYANIETLALHSSYAQDDWGRWGEQASNMKGHEVRLGYVPMKNANFLARFYSLETISDDPQDGMRFRLDFNYKF